MERILVRLPNWLGDLLMARPLLHALRHARPDAEITVVGEPALLELIAGEVVADRRRAWTREPAERTRLVHELKSTRPDAALVLPPSFSSALFAWRTGARERIGFRGELRDLLLTRALARPPRGELHVSREYLALGAVVAPAAAAAAPPPLLPPPRQGVERAAAVMARAGGGRAPLALLGPGALYGPAKRWEPARFAAVGRSLAARGYRVLVCGAAAEREVCAAVAAGVGGGALSLAGETDLATQAGLCAAASLALCNDSGLAHLAAATGAPTVAVFGSTSSAWTAPLGPRVRIVQRAPVCAPCFQHTCRIGYRCLAAVGVDTVLGACLEVAA
jgi:heptosyltransferase-2